MCVQELKLPVVGSQIVGLIPLKALLDSADFYIHREGLFIVEEEHKIRLVRFIHYDVVFLFLFLCCFFLFETTFKGHQCDLLYTGNQQTGPGL